MGVHFDELAGGHCFDGDLAVLLVSRVRHGLWIKKNSGQGSRFEYY